MVIISQRNPFLSEPVAQAPGVLVLIGTDGVKDY